MTLIDTAAGFGATLAALGAELGLELPIAELVAALGAPLDRMLAPHLPEADLPAVTDRFRLGEMGRSEEHTSELQSHVNLVCRLLLEKKKNKSMLLYQHTIA